MRGIGIKSTHLKALETLSSIMKSSPVFGTYFYTNVEHSTLLECFKNIPKATLVAQTLAALNVLAEYIVLSNDYTTIHLIVRDVHLLETHDDPGVRYNIIWVYQKLIHKQFSCTNIDTDLQTLTRILGFVNYVRILDIGFVLHIIKLITQFNYNFRAFKMNRNWFKDKQLISMVIY